MFSSQDKELKELLKNIQLNDIQLPDFQRGWVWDNDRIKALIASITLTYPIGTIMLLENGDNFRFKCRSIEGNNNETKIPSHLILDGQQRLTSTFLALKSKNAVHTQTTKKESIKRYYYLDIQRCLNTTIDRVEAIIDVGEDKTVRSNFGKNIDIDLRTTEDEYKYKMYPANIIFDENARMNWQNGYYEYYNYNAEIIKEFSRFATDIVQQNVYNYKLPVITIGKEVPKEAVCQVFENVNQGGVSLTVFELVTASFAADDFDLRASWKEVKDTLDKDDILRSIDESSFLTAITLLVSYKKHIKENTAISCKKRDVLQLTLDEYKENLTALVEGYKKASRFLIAQRIFSDRDLPYNTQLVPLSVICTVLADKFDNITVKEKISRWFWCGVLGELYGAANETRYVLDVEQVINWINEAKELPKTVTDCNFASLRLLTLQTRLSAAYKGIMALILKNDAKDWISGEKIDFVKFKECNTDIHHIFPQDYCVKNNYEKSKWNSIINKTPLYYSTNRKIGGRAPNEYIENIITKDNIESQILMENLNTHLVDIVYLNTQDFTSFIVDRATKLLDLIEQATGKKITDRSSEETIEKYGNALIREE